MERGMGEEWWIKAPPAQVVAVAGVVSFWLWLLGSGTIYVKILVPLFLMSMAYSVLRYGRLLLPLGVEAEPPKAAHSPWPVAFFLLVLLLLVSYRPNWW